MTRSHEASAVWCGWCHVTLPPHSHEVEGYRLFSTAETKREVIRILLDNVFPTPTSRHLHFDTRQHLSNRLFFRVQP